MAENITIRAWNQYNERFAPSGAKKAYLARVTGRDKSTTFKREFLSKEHAFDAADCPVLVERRNTDKKGRADEPDFFLLLANADGSLHADDPSEATVSREDAMWLAAQMDAGRSLDQCWDVDGWCRQSAAQAERAAVAATIDATTDACWQLLRVLSEKDAKKVLAALKQRVSPPKPAAAVGLNSDAPVGVVADANRDAGVTDQALGMGPTPVAEEGGGC